MRRPCPRCSSSGTFLVDRVGKGPDARTVKIDCRACGGSGYEDPPPPERTPSPGVEGFRDAALFEGFGADYDPES